MTGVDTAIILAGGLGTRMVPATKAVAKEMLPIVDRPLIQYAVEEAAAAGIGHVVIVLGPGKEEVEEHFAASNRVVEALRERNDPELLARVEEPANLARFSFVVQEEPLGIAHAVSCARGASGDVPFVLMFPDDLIFGDEPVAAQLVARHNETGGTVLAVQEVPPDEASNYGVVDAREDEGLRVRGMVEKPPPGEAPSNLAIVGRYVIAASIFEHIERLEPGAGGEYQITDAIAAQVRAGEPVHAVRYRGTRYDTGRPAGYLRAFVAAAMRRPEFAEDIQSLRDMLDGKAPA